MSDLLKKLAFTEVYILVSDNQVTLLIIFKNSHFESISLKTELTFMRRKLSVKVAHWKKIEFGKFWRAISESLAYTKDCQGL